MKNARLKVIRTEHYFLVKDEGINASVEVNDLLETLHELREDGGYCSIYLERNGAMAQILKYYDVLVTEGNRDSGARVKPRKFRKFKAEIQNYIKEYLS